jgi:hypothetical protein
MENISLADLGYEGGAKIPPASEGTGKTAQGLTTSIEARALQLLGSGIAAEATANALGVTPSRISQLLSEQQFSDQVATLRYENLQKHNTRDSAYDSMEDRLLDKLEAAIPLMFKPQEILRGISIINGAKRRGQSAPDQTINQQNIVNLVLPEIIAQRFTVNIDNQVTRAGDQELHTMPASSLLKTVEKQIERQQEVLSHMNAPLPEGELLEAL